MLMICSARAAKSHVTVLLWRVNAIYEIYGSVRVSFDWLHNQT